MTKFNELSVKSNKSAKRVGRGISAGQGMTAGRGTKGQKSRTGHKKMRPTFMGGQLPFVKGAHKLHGFKSLRAPAQIVYLDHLNSFAGKVADNFTLFDAGLIVTPYQAVKVIARGELTEKITLNVSGASSSVKAAIEKAGGTFTKTAVPLKVADKKLTKSDK